MNMYTADRVEGRQVEVLGTHRVTGCHMCHRQTLQKQTNKQHLDFTIQSRRTTLCKFYLVHLHWHCMWHGFTHLCIREVIGYVTVYNNIFMTACLHPGWLIMKIGKQVKYFEFCTQWAGCNKNCFTQCCLWSWPWQGAQLDAKWALTKKSWQHNRGNEAER